LQLAEELGAQTVRLSGDSVAETLVSYALRRNVTKIVAGKPVRPRWREWRRGSFIDQIVQLSQDIDVYVISGKPAYKQTAVTTNPAQKSVNRRSWLPYVLSGGLVLLATLLGLLLRPFISPTNLLMLYLAVVMITAVRHGRQPAILASLLSVILFDIVFVPPYYTLSITDIEILLTFAGFLAMSMVIGSLVTFAREQTTSARAREAQTTALLELSQKLAVISDLKTIVETAVQHLHVTFNSEVALFLPDPNGHLTLSASTTSIRLSPDDYAAADWVFHQAQPAGHHTNTLAGMRGYFLPLRTSGQILGVITIEFPLDSPAALIGEQQRLLASLASQIALAIAKAYLTEQARLARLLEETEKLQTTLLNSISHDLRTPLASITGALSSLLDDADLLDAAAQYELLNTAWEQALRLNRLVGNLLNMTRLESGAMRVVSEPYDVQELVGATLAQMPNRLKGRVVRRAIPDNLPPVLMDLTLMIQAFMNLVDNAVKYSPPDEPIDIEAYQLEQMVALAVKDRGAGVPEAEFEHIFTKFFRLDPGGVGGTGLGLSIARGIVAAHNGRVWVENRPEGGAVFTIALPIVGENTAVSPEPVTHPLSGDSQHPAP
jgi:two-component system, OmpR family, sensor histidine kinase KdpD